jgi:2-keto-4-pentenoate hydratase/2-oxohepta-3-ene-1,7-dioic acid hydratase in catechol pathway
LRFVTIQRDGYQEPGVLADAELIGLRDAGFPDMLSVIAGGADAMDRILRWAGNPPGGARHDPATQRLAAPIPRPPKIICIGLNYRDHAIESNLPIPQTPTVFAKFPTAVIGPGQPIVLPKNSTQPDYEAEFAVVIGKRVRHVPEERWRDVVFGYTILNDVSARDFQMISLELSGELLQNSNTSNLIFNVPKLIAYLSGVFTLEPGDIIATGTPSGVGFARKPPRYLRPGDDCRVRIEGLGELYNPVIAEE